MDKRREAAPKVSEPFNGGVASDAEVLENILALPQYLQRGI
jgi:hypothetical protein